MTRVAKIIATLTATIGIAACSGEPREPAPATALASTRQVMLGITVPTSAVVFGVGENAPASDADWEQVQASAMSLAESANLLKVGSRRIEAQEWLQYVDTLIAASRAAAEAAQEKNVDKVLEAGNQIYEVCEACHKQYLPARGGV